jgi:hypothetical protein
MTDLRVRPVRFDFVSAADQATDTGASERQLTAMTVDLVRSQGHSHDPTAENLPVSTGGCFECFDEKPTGAARRYSVGALHPSPMSEGRISS